MQNLYAKCGCSPDFPRSLPIRLTQVMVTLVKDQSPGTRIMSYRCPRCRQVVELTPENLEPPRD